MGGTGHCCGHFHCQAQSPRDIPGGSVGVHWEATSRNSGTAGVWGNDSAWRPAHSLSRQDLSFRETWITRSNCSWDPFFFEIQNWMVYMLLACTYAFKSSSPNVFRGSPVLRYSRPVNRATHVPRGALEICYPQCITRGATDSPSLRNPS